jgi:hypothetical protein
MTIWHYVHKYIIVYSSYSHHLASVSVVRRKLFQKSAPLKVLDQWKPNLVWIITRVSSFKIVSGDAVQRQAKFLEQLKWSQWGWNFPQEPICKILVLLL